MITNLTTEQHDQLAVYRDKGLKHGLCTDPVDVDAARKWAARLCVEILGRNAPTEVIVRPSPLAAWREVCRVELGEDAKPAPFVWPYIEGQYMTAWIAHTLYMRDVLGVTGYPDGYDVIVESQEFGPVYPLECGVVVISDRPAEIHMVEGHLHNEAGPAVRYRDDWGVWCLNGVRVPRSLVETPAEKLDAHEILHIDNAEVRREYVRKMGIELVCQRLGAKVIDKKSRDVGGEYELLMLDLGDGRNRPYLKMINPSTGTYHVEGVPPECTTVDDALAWANQTDEEPEVLT